MSLTDTALKALKPRDASYIVSDDRGVAGSKGTGPQHRRPALGPFVGEALRFDDEISLWATPLRPGGRRVCSLPMDLARGNGLPSGSEPDQTDNQEERRARCTAHGAGFYRSVLPK